MKDENRISQNPSITTECNVGKRNERITINNTIIWNILYRTLTFFMSLYLTAHLIGCFAYEIDGITSRSVGDQVACFIMFICVTFLLTNLLINDKKID